MGDGVSRSCRGWGIGWSLRTSYFVTESHWDVSCSGLLELNLFLA